MKQNLENREALRTAMVLLNYWREHPNAKDNAHGIARYWVGEREEAVAQALAWLAAEGVIIKRRSLYRLAQAPPEPVKAQTNYWNKTLRRLRESFLRER